MVEQNKNNEQVKRKTRLQRLKEKCAGSLKLSFIFFSGIHIATIVIAAVYYDKCPVEPDIPKYLLSLGVLGMASKLISLFKNFLIKHVSVSAFLSFILTAELALLIVGSYYVYREFKPNYDSESGLPYCDKTLYMFAFVYMTVIYALIFLFVAMIGCFVLSLVLLDEIGSPDDETEEDAATEGPISTEKDNTSDKK